MHTVQVFMLLLLLLLLLAQGTGWFSLSCTTQRRNTVGLCMQLLIKLLFTYADNVNYFAYKFEQIWTDLKRLKTETCVLIRSRLLFPPSKLSLFSLIFVCIKCSRTTWQACWPNLEGQYLIIDM